MASLLIPLMELRKSVAAGGDPPAFAAIDVFNALLEEAQARRPSNKILAMITPFDDYGPRAEMLVYIGQMLAAEHSPAEPRQSTHTRSTNPVRVTNTG